MTLFDYFQIASLIIFIVIVVTKAIYLRSTAGINAIVIGRGKKGFQLVFEFGAFAGLAVWIAEFVSYALQAKLHVFRAPLDMRLIDSDAARIAGVVLISIGLVIFIWAFVSFGNSWRVGVDSQTPGALVTSGIFAHSRNPIYVFLDLWFAGIFLINGRLIFLIFMVLALAALHYQMIREERFLSQRHGQEYEDYRSRTGRYFQFVSQRSGVGRVRNRER
ncbi:MAG TPA: isoprenylcysteine carboxylmethyltransferase family protein [Pyrinomonadaceae bacterium]|nr:isoprenylcysteine carboxylmethyltransferase family protein [Pyrinomonadaceae bacterium]